MYPRKSTFEFNTSEILFFQTTLDGETTKTKVVDIEKLYNFVVDNFSFEIICYSRKTMFQFSHIWNSKILNNVRVR
jgi:hypothetical protein